MFVADFYCAKARLIIELDGSGHYSKPQMVKDEIRTKELEAMNLQALRICNTDIDRDFNRICEYIDIIVKKLAFPSL